MNDIFKREFDNKQNDSLWIIIFINILNYLLYNALIDSNEYRLYTYLYLLLLLHFFDSILCIL